MPCSTRSSTRCEPARFDGGQATVEAALLLPFVFTLLLVVVQVGLLVRAQILVTHAAREGARAAAVDAAADAGRNAATSATTLDAGRMQVSVDGRGAAGTRVHVRVTYDTPTDVPIIGALVGDVELQADATMRVE